MSKGLFVAAPVNQAATYSDFAQELWRDHGYIQWFPPESMHCTLAYVDIGCSERPVEQLVIAILQACRKAIQGQTKFKFTLDQFEWFGPNHEILVVTSPIQKTPSKITKLARSLQRRIRARRLRVLSYDPFRAHVSLGHRSVDRCNVHSSPFNSSPSCVVPLRLEVDRICIYQVWDHSRYEILRTVELPEPKPNP